MRVTRSGDSRSAARLVLGSLVLTNPTEPARATRSSASRARAFCSRAACRPACATAALTAIAALAPAPAAAQDTGQVVVITDPPGCVVSADGAAIGPAPVTVPSLLPGAHLISVVCDTGATDQRVIEVVAGRSDVVSFVLASPAPPTASSGISGSPAPPTASSPGPAGAGDGATSTGASQAGGTAALDGAAVAPDARGTTSTVPAVAPEDETPPALLPRILLSPGERYTAGMGVGFGIAYELTPGFVVNGDEFLQHRVRLNLELSSMIFVAGIAGSVIDERFFGPGVTMEIRIPGLYAGNFVFRPTLGFNLDLVFGAGLTHLLGRAALGFHVLYAIVRELAIDIGISAPLGVSMIFGRPGEGANFTGGLTIHAGMEVRP